MNDPIEIVAGVVTLNDGELVGKVRLQKTLYLLDACGLQSGFDYEFQLEIMKRYSAAELEIAANIIFLREHGHPDDAEAETCRRKPATATSDRIAKARRLISELGLD